MVDLAPVIVIGAARSGTKFLRDVLAAPSGVVCVPYDVNYVWRYGNQDFPHDALTPEQLTDQNIHKIRQELYKLSKCASESVMIEKTVSNTLRVDYVDRVYPNARFVHLVRDGRDVVESAMRQWRAKPDVTTLLKKLRGVPLGSSSYVYWFAKNFISGVLRGRGGGKVWGPRFPGIDDLVEKVSLAELCAVQWRESVVRAQHGLKTISRTEERVFSIGYEDLVNDERAIKELLEGLQIPNLDQAICYYQSHRRAPEPQRWKDLSAKDQASIMSIVDSVDTGVKCQ